MVKKFFTLLVLSFTTLTVNAYEDCIVINNGKITDISIEDNTIVDVYPLVTVNNNKNTLIFHPLKDGKTRVCALKNNKNIIMFNVEINDLKTIVNAPDGFEVFTLDTPTGEADFTLDSPPIINGGV